MSHNLLMQNGQASMFYIDEVPWHGLGTKLDKPATAQEAITAARLDWKVVKLPLFAGSKHIPVAAAEFRGLGNEKPASGSAFFRYWVEARVGIGRVSPSTSHSKSTI